MGKLPSDSVYAKESKELTTLALVAILRNEGSRRGQERNVRLLLEHRLLLNAMQKHAGYLARHVQNYRMEPLEDDDVPDLSVAYYKRMLEVFGKVPITVWEPSVWVTAVETMEGLKGETFTYAMWKDVRPQIWAWDAQWPNLAWKCLRTRMSKIRRTETRFVVVVPMMVGESEEDELPMVAFFDIMLAMEGSLPSTWQQLLPYISVQFVHVGEAIPECNYYSPLYFLEQKFVDVELVRGTPEEETILKRYKTHDDAIQEVLLRRLKRKETRDGQGVEYQYQWTVAGHIRNQWYPSTQEHKMIFIEPYLKGPEDAPMMPFKGSLYVAKR